MHFIRFEVLTAVVMKSSLPWDITPYRPVKTTYVSEEYVASIFRVGKKTKKESNTLFHSRGILF
jgi:hypothetical protein